MWLLWVSIGFIVGALTRFIKTKKKSKYTRRGIIFKQYQVTTAGLARGSFEVQLEVGEIEKTDKRSKIMVIGCIASASEHNDSDSIEKVKKLVNCSWERSEDIEWITESIEDIRNEKLDKILK